MDLLEGILDDDLCGVSEAQPMEAHIFQVVRRLAPKRLDRKWFGGLVPYSLITAAGHVLTGGILAHVIEPERTDPSWFLNVALSFEVELFEPLDIYHDGNQPTGVACHASRDRTQPSGREHGEMAILV